MSLSTCVPFAGPSILLEKDKAELLENGRGQIHSTNSSYTIPSVIRLAYLVRRPFAKRKLSKREIFLRDRHTCQYCGAKVKDLTLDHVVPRRQDGGHSWENIVAACGSCNRRKAGRTPAEAGMAPVETTQGPLSQSLLHPAPSHHPKTSGASTSLGKASRARIADLLS